MDTETPMRDMPLCAASSFILVPVIQRYRGTNLRNVQTPSQLSRHVGSSKSSTHNYFRALFLGVQPSPSWLLPLAIA